MGGLLLVLAVILGSVIVLQLSTRVNPKRIAKLVRVFGTILALAGALALTVAGRMGLAIPLFMLAAWLMGWPLRLPWAGRTPYGAGADDRGQTRASPPGSTSMTRTRALDILGLDARASAHDIRQAHKQLMQKLHPDHGGSTHLAAEVNAAKDFLLGR